MVKDKIPYIQDWHDYVDKEPNKHCQDIKKLKKLVEKLLKSKTVFYDDTDVEAFISYCRLMKHREGKLWAGKPFELSIEQKYIAACIFGFKVYDHELKMEVRYFKELVLFVARKWGKSFFISAIADFLLMADGEPAAQIWCLATQKTQAAIVYEAAKALLMSSNVLTPPNNKTKHWKTKRDKDNCEMILYPATNSMMKAGSKNSQSQDGLNPHAYIIDEIHALKDRNTYDVFSSATGARTQPLGVIISTFGFVREGIFDSIFERCQKVLNGKSEERLFPMIFRIDDDDDPEDRTCWVKANPGLGSHPTMSYLEGEYQKALEDPAQMPSFLAKHLNRASSLSIVYFDVQEINKCAADMSIEMIQDKYAVGGVDLAETTDLCCASALIPIDGILHLFQKYFIAEARLEHNTKQDKMAYESFTCTNAEDELNKHLLKICDGAMVKKGDVTEWFCELAEKYGVTFWKIGWDRWHGGDWADDMEMRGFPKEDNDGKGVTFPVAMGAKSLSAPMKQTKVIFKDKLMRYSRHNGLFRWCVTNTAAKIDTNKEIQPDKAKSRHRIDGYVSFLIAYIAYLKCVEMFEEYQ
jgi:phage terminase large subunit-like protein